MKHSGGYYLLSEPLIKTGIHQHTLAVPEPVPEPVLCALNTVQATPWRINSFVLGVLREAWATGFVIGEMPPAHDLPLPPRVDDATWAAMSKMDRANHKREMSLIHGENARSIGKREDLLRKLQVATEMEGEERVWFPHNLDFRGRQYPMPQDLHPQSDDIGRSLLMFAEGKPITDAGAYWLGVHVANSFGYDKVSLDDRMKWALDNEPLIRDAVKHPLDGTRLWWKAESPWQFLAAAHEWVMYLDEGPALVSHLPVHVDGSCNGLQHLSAMGRDPVGALATNLTGDPARHDIYQLVADAVNDLIEADLKTGTYEQRTFAANWRGKVTRKVVKRAVMTTPYGVTDFGMREQLIDDRHLAEVDGPPIDNATYLRDKLKVAIAGTVVSARNIMDWLQTTAETLAKHDIPLDWRTPSGFHIRQAYYKKSLKRIRTLFGDGQRSQPHLWVEDAQLGLDVNKQALAAAPNIIHSFDAAHLTATVNAATKRGINSFSVIHDSFGTHAADMVELGGTLRDTFADIYEDNWLDKLHADFQAAAGDKCEIAPPPATGTFNINEVKNARYFFS